MAPMHKVSRELVTFSSTSSARARRREHCQRRTFRRSYDLKKSLLQGKLLMRMNEKEDELPGPEHDEERLANRSKRMSKAPSRFDDSNEFWPAKQKQGTNGGRPLRQVYRVLKKKDISEALKDQSLFVKWPDDGSWWAAEVQQVDRKNDSMLVVYFDTEEEETLAISEVLANKEIAVLELRNPNAKLRKNEFPVSKDGTEVWRNPESDVESEDEFQDAGAMDDSDDDASVMSDAAPDDHKLTITSDDKQEMRSQSVGGKRKLADRSGLKHKALSENVKGGAFYGSSVKPSRGPASKVQKTGSPAAAKQAPLPQGPKPPIPVTDVRKNAWKKFQECMDRAVQELKEKGAEVAELKDPEEVAKSIEAECAKHYAHAGITKEYKLKFRTLFFNLKDSNNEELRQRVVLGELSPARLVGMSNDELASQEVSQWRQGILETNKKRVVLDTEAAAKFSTAANQSLRMREIALSQEQKAAEEAKRVAAAAAAQRRAKHEAAARSRPDMQQHHALSKVMSMDAGGSGSGAEPAADAPDPDFIDFDAFVQQSGGYVGTAALRRSPVYNDTSNVDEDESNKDDSGCVAPDAATQPHVDTSTASAELAHRAGATSSPTYNPVQPLRPSDDRAQTPPLDDPDCKFLHREPNSSQRHRRPLTHKDPRPGAAVSDPLEESHRFQDVEDLAPVVLPSHGSFPGNGAPGVKMWSGWVSMPAVGKWRMDLVSVQGAGDLRRIVLETTIGIRGRLPLVTLFKFFGDLRPSRSRTITLSVLRPSSVSDKLDDYKQFVEELKSEGKAAACFPSGDEGNREGRNEGYIIPRSDLTASLCASAHVAAAPRHKGAVQDNISDCDLMLAIVHRRGSADAQPAQELQARLRRDKARMVKQARLAAKREGATTQQPSREGAIKPDAKQPVVATPVSPPASPPATVPAPVTSGPNDPRQRGVSMAPPPPPPPQEQSLASAAAPAATPASAAVPPAFDIAALAASIIASSTPKPSIAPAAPPSPTPASKQTAATAPLNFDIGSSLNSLASALGIKSDADAASLPGPPPSGAASLASPLSQAASRPTSLSGAMPTQGTAANDPSLGGAGPLSAYSAAPSLQLHGGSLPQPSAPIIIPHHLLGAPQQISGVNTHIIPHHLLSQLQGSLPFVQHSPQQHQLHSDGHPALTARAQHSGAPRPTAPQQHFSPYVPHGAQRPPGAPAVGPSNSQYPPPPAAGNAQPWQRR